MSSSTVAYLVQNPAKPPFAGAQILYTIYSSVLSIGVISRTRRTAQGGGAMAWVRRKMRLGLTARDRPQRRPVALTKG
jgi:hypothetical protein